MHRWQIFNFPVKISGNPPNTPSFPLCQKFTRGCKGSKDKLTPSYNFLPSPPWLIRKPISIKLRREKKLKVVLYNAFLISESRKNALSFHFALLSLFALLRLLIFFSTQFDTLTDTD